MTDEPHPLLDLDDAGQVVLGVVGDQLRLPGTRPAPVAVAEPVAAAPAVEPVPGQLGLVDASSVLGGSS